MISSFSNFEKLDIIQNYFNNFTSVAKSFIQPVEPVKEHEEKRLLSFIDTIEKASLELKYLGREAEIKNSTIISIIEEKLPDDLRRKWIERIYDKDSKIDKSDKFPGFLKFLLERKMVIEYGLNVTKKCREEFRGSIKMSVSRKDESEKPATKCLLHPNGAHKTEDCRLFLDKNVPERAEIIKENRACFNCLTIGHTSRTCRSKKTCSKSDCGRNHHVLLHDDNFQANGCQKASFSAKCGLSSSSEKSLLQIMPIKIMSPSNNQRVLALWDSGSTVSLVLNSLARKLKLRGKPVSIVLETLGNICKRQTNLFSLAIKDMNNKLVTLEAYGVDEISKDLYSTAPQKELFPEEFKVEEQKAAPIGLLLGLNVVQHHPAPIKRKENFVLFENSFGKCVSGTSVAPLSQDAFTKVNFVQTDVTLEDFYKVENMGLECSPKCCNCKLETVRWAHQSFLSRNKRSLT